MDYPEGPVLLRAHHKLHPRCGFGSGTKDNVDQRPPVQLYRRRDRPWIRQGNRYGGVRATDNYGHIPDYRDICFNLRGARLPVVWPVTLLHIISERGLGLKTRSRLQEDQRC